jgi:hypothetical protein
MSRVYVFPPSEEDLLGSEQSRDDAVGVTDVMEEGDHLVRRYGEQVRVWRVGPAGAEHLGELPVSSLPDDARADLDLDPAEVQTPDDASSLEQAIDGFETALRTRGG